MKTLQVILDDELVATVAIIPLRIDAFDLPSRSQARPRADAGTRGKNRFVKYGKIAVTPLKKHIQADDFKFSEHLIKPST